MPKGISVLTGEKELINQLETHKQLAISCANGTLGFWEFVRLYNNFYHHYALDGHEPGTDPQLLKKYASEIGFHFTIFKDILSVVCADSDSNNPAYIKAGRIDSVEAFARLKRLCDSGT